MSQSSLDRHGIALTLRRFLSRRNTRWLSFTYTYILHKCKYPFLWGSIREIRESCRGLPWLLASKTARRDPVCSFIPSRRMISKFHREDAHNFILPPEILLLFSICTPPPMLASSSLSGMHNYLNSKILLKPNHSLISIVNVHSQHIIVIQSLNKINFNYNYIHYSYNLRLFTYLYGKRYA